MICSKCGKWSDDLHFGECAERCCDASPCVAVRKQVAAKRAALEASVERSAEPGIALPDAALAEHLQAQERQRSERERARLYFWRAPPMLGGVIVGT